MLQVSPLSEKNVGGMEPLYREFLRRAAKDYRWDLEPVDFMTFSALIAQNRLTGYVVEDTVERRAVGFMLYCVEAHRAIEVNLVFMEKDYTGPKAFLDAVLVRFLTDVRERDDWDVISWAMLGVQEEMIRSATWYGFKPAGQAILKFDMLDSLTVQIFKQQQFPPLPDGYAVAHWKPEYVAETAQSIYEAFHQSADANWDPRFRTLEGAKEALGHILTGAIGKHLAQCTAILLKEGVPVGFCFLVQTEVTLGNVPLVGIRPTEHGKGFGKLLLHKAIDACMAEILANRMAIQEITATMETDNGSAIQMYRQLGFREEYNYPHVFLSREMLRNSSKVGAWCQ